MIGLSCYILADTFFIANGVGPNGLTALNLAIPVYSVIHGVGLMLGMGGATKYSICNGQGDTQNAKRLFANTAYTALAFSIVFVTLGVFFSQGLSNLLGADAEVFSMTNIYLKCILLFSPAFLMNDVLICFVRNDGNPRLSMLAMLGGSLSNILLDYVFIYPFGMGMFGAVLATGIAPVISMLILLFHLLGKQNHIQFEKKLPQFTAVGSILRLGFPSLVTEVSSGIVIIVFNAILLRLQGNTGVAAYGIIANLSLVVVAVYTGVAQGIQPLISRAYGQNDGAGIRRVVCYAIVTALLISALVNWSILSFTEQIAGAFNGGGDMLLQETAVSGMKIYFFAAVFVGFNLIVSMYFTATNRAFPAYVISLSRGFIVILPMAFLLSYLMGVTGVWLSFPVTEVSVFIFAIVLYSVDKKKLK